MGVRPKGKGGQLTETQIKEMKKKFLIKYSRTGVLTQSAEAAGTTAQQIRRWLAKDEKFLRKFDQMQEKFVDRLEMVAVQRAIDKSDSLLQMLLRANRPQKYRDNVKVDADVNEKKTVKLVFSAEEMGEMPNYAFPQGGVGDGDQETGEGQ